MTRSEPATTDAIILGGGLVGLALAAALDSAGLRCTIVDPANPDDRRDARFDGRTTAVSSSSMRMLRTTGVLDHLPAEGCAIQAIRVRSEEHTSELQSH